MTRFFLRTLACLAWLLATWAITKAATDYSDTLRYVLGGVGLALFWIGVYCWFGCRRPVVNDAEAMKRAARRLEGER